MSEVAGGRGAPGPALGVLGGPNTQTDGARRRSVDITQPAQRLVIALGGLQRQLLDGIGPLIKGDESYGMAGEAAGGGPPLRRGAVRHPPGPNNPHKTPGSRAGGGPCTRGEGGDPAPHLLGDSVG